MEGDYAGEKKGEKTRLCRGGDAREGGLSALSRPTASANGGHCGDKSERGKNLFIGSLVFTLFHSFASPQQRESLNILSVSSVYRYSFKY